MNLPLLKPQSVSSIHEFINDWSKLYAYASSVDYETLINKKVISKKDLRDLFVWKNGMKLSGLKAKSFDQKIKKQFIWIKKNRNNSDLDLEEFKSKFKSVSTVWKIFLLHVINHKKYPIYDQHTHRAYLFFHNEPCAYISSSKPSNKLKEEFYFNTYLPFVKDQNITDLKKMDEAFFAFGQFLNTRTYAKLVNS